MLPVVNIAGTYNTIPPPLVNTAVPGSTVVHAPYDNVAPSVSTAQADNHTRGNSTPPPPIPETAPLASGGSAAAFALPAGDSDNVSAGSAQTAFIAQLLAQDASPETQGVLVQYEKLIALANVKFKPSNALKPQLEPASVFGQILHQDHAAPVHETPEPAPRAAEQSKQAQADSQPQADAAQAPPQPLQPQAISAYAASVTRQALQQFKVTSELA